MKIPITIPSINEADIDSVVSVLKSGQLVQGKQVEMLELEISKYLNVEHAIAVSSGTASLHLALLALGIGVGDEVIVPAFSFVATANVVELVGATPVFVDINLDSFNIDESHIEAAISTRTKAIIPVHEFGFPANMDVIMAISRKYDIRIIEDAACALGAEWEGVKVGGIGDVSSFSFHPRKAITSGEGGVLTTNSKDLANYFRIMRNHGIKQGVNGLEFVAAGLNYRMTDIQAALVLSQFKRINDSERRRKEVVLNYGENLDDECLIKPLFPEFGKMSWQSYHVLLRVGNNRNDFLKYLREKGIGSNYGAQCIPVQEYYKKKYNYKDIDFPKSLSAYTNGAVLPLYDGISDQQVEYVINSVNHYFRSKNDKK